MNIPRRSLLNQQEANTSLRYHPDLTLSPGYRPPTYCWSLHLKARLAPLETSILFDLPDQWKFWEAWARKIGRRLEKFQMARLKRDREGVLNRSALRIGVRSSSGRNYWAPSADFKKAQSNWSATTGRGSGALRVAVRSPLGDLSGHFLKCETPNFLYHLRR